MSLYDLIILLIVLGLVAFLIQRFAPIEARFKSIIVWLLVIVAVFIVLNATGACAVIKSMAVPHV